MSNSEYRTAGFDSVPLELLVSATSVQPLSAQRRAEMNPSKDHLYAELELPRAGSAAMTATVARMPRGIRVFDLGGDALSPGFEMQAGIHGFDL